MSARDNNYNSQKAFVVQKSCICTAIDFLQEKSYTCYKCPNTMEAWLCLLTRPYCTVFYSRILYSRVLHNWEFLGTANHYSSTILPPRTTLPAYLGSNVVSSITKYDEQQNRKSLYFCGTDVYNIYHFMFFISACCVTVFTQHFFSHFLIQLRAGDIVPHQVGRGDTTSMTCAGSQSTKLVVGLIPEHSSWIKRPLITLAPNMLSPTLNHNLHWYALPRHVLDTLPPTL